MAPRCVSTCNLGGNAERKKWIQKAVKQNDSMSVRHFTIAAAVKVYFRELSQYIGAEKCFTFSGDVQVPFRLEKHYLNYLVALLQNPFKCNFNSKQN